MTSLALSIESVSKTFHVGAREVHAVRDVSLQVTAGECLAVVGESGSGKSTLANMILGIFPPTAGAVSHRGKVLPARRDLVQRRAIQLVQQNPLSSLNPMRTIGASLRLALDVHGIGDKSERWARVEQLLEAVQLSPDYRKRAPTSLSGGERQRVAIARALACDSEIIVLDEPTSALDVLVQARMLRLLSELQRERGLTYLFITHDLSVVRNIADRVAVFEGGRLVEVDTVDTIFTQPKAAYTRRLIGSVPVVTSAEERLRDRLVAG